MSQTVKFGKMRAENDPDRDRIDHGRYYGNNGNRRNRSFSPHNWRTTNGVWRKRES